MWSPFSANKECRLIGGEGRQSTCRLYGLRWRWTQTSHRESSNPKQVPGARTGPWAHWRWHHITSPSAHSIKDMQIHLSEPSQTTTRKPQQSPPQWTHSQIKTKLKLAKPWEQEDKKSVTDRVPGWNEEVVAVVAEPQIGDAVGGRRRQLPPRACGCGGCRIPSSSYHAKLHNSYSFLSFRMRLRNIHLWSRGGQAEGNDRCKAMRKSEDATTKKKAEENRRARRRVGGGQVLQDSRTRARLTVRFSGGYSHRVLPRHRHLCQERSIFEIREGHKCFQIAHFT